MANKPKIWSNERVTDYSLNQNIAMPLSNMDATDNTVQTTTSTSFTTVRTLAIGANQVANYIIIEGDVVALGNPPGSSGGSVTADVQITIDGTQRFTTNIGQATNVASGIGVKAIKPFVFKYTPTSGEKSAGFTIDLDLKYTESGSVGGGSDAENNFWKITGA